MDRISKHIASLYFSGEDQSTICVEPHGDEIALLREFNNGKDPLLRKNLLREKNWKLREFRRAYKKVRAQYHPDRNKSAEAEVIFCELDLLFTCSHKKPSACEKKCTICHNCMYSLWGKVQCRWCNAEICVDQGKTFE